MNLIENRFFNVWYYDFSVFKFNQGDSVDSLFTGTLEEMVREELLSFN